MIALIFYFLSAKVDKINYLSLRINDEILQSLLTMEIKSNIFFEDKLSKVLYKFSAIGIR